MGLQYCYKTVLYFLLWQRLFFLEWTTFKTSTLYTNGVGGGVVLQGRRNNLESPQSHFKVGENIITPQDHPWTYSFKTIFSFYYKDDTIKLPSLFSYNGGKCYINIVKNEKVSDVNIFKNTFSKSKPKSLVPQYSRIILNKGQNPTTIKQLTCQTLNLLHSFKVCKKWSQKLPFSRLSNKAENSMTSLYLFSPSSSSNHKEKGTKGRKAEFSGSFHEMILALSLAW